MGSTFDDISKLRNRQDTGIAFLTDQDTTLQDFYWKYNRGIEPYDSTVYNLPSPATAERVDDTSARKYGSKHFYELQFSNKGGLVMPIIIEWTYKDSTKEVERIPAQVWRLNEAKVTKFFMKDKEVASIRIDPMRETSDIDESNNSWGNTAAAPTRFQVFKQKTNSGRGQSTGPNPMQKAKEKRGF
jgi:hypothetical protein